MNLPRIGCGRFEKRFKLSVTTPAVKKMTVSALPLCSMYQASSAAVYDWLIQSPITLGTQHLWIAHQGSWAA